MTLFVGLAATMLLLQVLAPVSTAWLAFDRGGIASGQLWRLVTAHLVHLGWAHTLLNLAGLVMVLAITQPHEGGRRWAARLLWLAMGVSAGLWWASTDLQHYVGFSGVLHGLFAWALWPMLRRRDRLAWLCAVLLVAKLAAETGWGASAADAALIGGTVITEAHLFGVLAAITGVIVSRWLDARAPSRR